MAHVRIFLSAVSNEFRSYRDRLAEKLKRPNLSVHVQEDFIAAGTETIDKLDDYIRECEAVVHLVGDMTGAMASPSAVAAIKERYPDLATRFPPLAETLSTGAPQLSYTQWEAFLALYHRKVLIIATPTDGAPRDETYRKIDAETASQQAHLQRLRSCHRYPEISFAGADDLIIEVLRSQNILSERAGLRLPEPQPVPSLTGTQFRLSSIDIEVRARWLLTLKKDVESRLKASLHHRIDIEVRADFDAVRPSHVYRLAGENEEKTYSSSFEAFLDCRRSLLLLGGPGSGKSTELLLIAQNLIPAAEASYIEAVPLIINLSQFVPPRHFEKTRAFENWLVNEIRRHIHLSHTDARRWLKNGNIALLLDGLDEFNDDRRSDLAQHLNTAFLTDYSTIPIVICSRAHEYAALRKGDQTRLQLQGSVQIPPLTHSQVKRYLRALKQYNLLRAIESDLTLRELSQNPLTLSILVLAYAGSAENEIPRRASLSESRSILFDAYIKRMLQRQARRREGKQFDSLPSNDVPVSKYVYSPKSIDRWLGWLALTLSVRMKTSFSPRSFVPALLLIGSSRKEFVTFFIARIAVCVPVVLSLAIAAAPVIPKTMHSIGVATIAILVVWLLMPIVIRAFKWVFPLSLLFALGFALIAIIWETLRLTLSTTSIKETPILILPIEFLTTLVWNFMVEVYKYLKLPFSFLYHLVVGQYGWSGYFWTLVTFFIFVYLAPQLAGDDVDDVLFRPEETDKLTARQTRLFSLSLWMLLGGVIAGTGGSAIAAISSPFAGNIVNRIGKTEGRVTQARRYLENVTDGMISRVLSSFACALLALSWKLPWRFESFIETECDAFWLKKTASEYEFVHRLVRDHFALKQLTPRLRAGGRGTVNAIEALGYQGEAALDPLIEFAERGDVPVRAAAITSLSHIPSPASSRAIEASVRDRAPEVRVAVIEAILSGPYSEYSQRERLFKSMEPLGDRREILALFQRGVSYMEEYIAEYVARMGDGAAVVLMSVLRSGKTIPKRIGVGRIGYVTRVAYLLTSDRQHGDMQKNAARLLGGLRDRRIVPVLLEQMYSPYSDVRVAVIKALQAQSDIRAIKPIERFLRDSNKRVRLAALEAIDGLKAEERRQRKAKDEKRAIDVEEHRSGEAEARGSGAEALPVRLTKDELAGKRITKLPRHILPGWQVYLLWASCSIAIFLLISYAIDHIGHIANFGEHHPIIYPIVALLSYAIIGVLFDNVLKRKDE